MSKTTILKRILLAVLALVFVVAITFIAFYGYLFMYAAYTWECKIYVGEHTPAGQKVCDDFKSGGFVKVLTN